MFSLARILRKNPFEPLVNELVVGGKNFKYFNLSQLKDPRVNSLPFTIRVLLESAIRNCDGLMVTEADVETILNWKQTNGQLEIPFTPARVLMQDFTGVAAVVDLAAMRNAIVDLGGKPSQVNPLVPVDLVIDHSVQVDFSGTKDAAEKNAAREFERNRERFAFLKWGSKSFKDFRIVPPGFGIVHQVNLEYLASVAFQRNGYVYPDSLVGTDSHTTMINGVGVLGWGVGGIEAESAMLGTPMSFLLPPVVGCSLKGTLQPGVTATDLVLQITMMLRKLGVVGKIVEFFGPGVRALALADRATIANMAPEYGATAGFFPVDNASLQYLKMTGRSADQLALIEAYYRANGFFNEPSASGTLPEASVEYSTLLEVDLSTVEPAVAGPKRPHDFTPLSKLKADYRTCMGAPMGFKGFGVGPEPRQKVEIEGMGGATLKDGDVVIAAITSCTNTSNPTLLMCAGLLAQKAVAKGLKVPPYVKTSLAPGSSVATAYLTEAGCMPALEALGFHVVGYGCTTCIGNSGDLKPGVSDAIKKGKLVASSVLSGNRNFEARVHADAMAAYLMSPPLVVAFALAGTVDKCLVTEPIGTDKAGNPVFLKDIWPSPEEISSAVLKYCTTSLFSKAYGSVLDANPRWNALPAPENEVFTWPESTYITKPPYFDGMTKVPAAPKPITNARVLLSFGDSITTDHISPAGNIAKGSPAAEWLQSHGVGLLDFNSYGSRRGNDHVMARGTFANTRLPNKVIGEGTTGPFTKHFPDGEKLPIFVAAQKYQSEGVPTIVFAQKEYGSGSSRDWAAKGPFLQGIRAVIAESFERIHRSNLVGMGILPLTFKEGETFASLGLSVEDTYDIEVPENPTPRMPINVKTGSGKAFQVLCRLDTSADVQYFKHGGILNFVLRRMVQ